MSRIKNHIEEEITRLAEETGYSEEFLYDRWEECMQDGNDWDNFLGVTEEQDW